MIRRYLLGLLLLLLTDLPVMAQYSRDILGSGYEKRTIEMPRNEQKERIVCTLVRKMNPDSCQQAVLYVHGYNDYFFQSQLGDSLIAHGYNFYAVDLRRYGRSLLPHQDAFYCSSIKEYFADLDTAIALIRAEGNQKIVLMGHSTGGLTTAYYLKYHPQAPIQGLILNSPFLDWNFSWFMETFAFPIVSFLGNFFPQWVVQGQGNSFSTYACSLLAGCHGEWHFDQAWKMPYGHPKRAGWVHAIQSAQQDLQRRCDIACPILLLSSDRSLSETAEWNSSMLTADVVLSVDDIQTYGRRLGKRMTARKVKGGIHDLILSPKPARDRAYHYIFEWLEELL